MPWLEKFSLLYLKMFGPSGPTRLWSKIERLYLFPRDRFENPLAAIFQVNWQNHYNFFYRQWQSPALKKAKDWWVVFWNFLKGVKNQVQAIPSSKQERRALMSSLANPYMARPLIIIFLLITLGVLLDSFPFWRKMKSGPIRYICAGYLFCFYKVLFFFWRQFLPPREIYVKMALSYVDMGNYQQAAVIARQMLERWPADILAGDLLAEIKNSGGIS